MHDLEWPERRYRVEFAPFTCSGPCNKAHADYVVLTYAIGVDAAKSKATTRLLHSSKSGHTPVVSPHALTATIDN